MNTTTAQTVRKIEAELARLGWFCTDATPCYYAVSADDDLPAGWVRVYDDNAEGYGPADDIISALQNTPTDAEYGTNCPTDGKPESSRDWPEELFTTEQLEEGTCNDEPNTLVTLQTNAGTRYAAGPHGVHSCALSDWFASGMPLAETREDAVSAGCNVYE